MEHTTSDRRWWNAALMTLLAVALILAGTGIARAETTVERVSFHVPIGGPCPAPYVGLDFEGLLEASIVGTYSSDGTFTEVWKVDGSLTVTAPEDRQGEVFLIRHRFTVSTVNGGVYASGLGFGMFDEQGRPVLIERGRIDLASDAFDPVLKTCQGVAGA